MTGVASLVCLLVPARLPAHPPAVVSGAPALITRCKMQDNLEFLQWMKKFWDANSPGQVYNASERTCVPLPVPAS